MGRCRLGDRGDVRLCAALLAGDMPEDIERAFAAAGTSLFPVSAKG